MFHRNHHRCSTDSNSPDTGKGSHNNTYHVHVSETIGMIVLGIIALVLLILYAKTESRYRKLLLKTLSTATLHQGLIKKFSGFRSCKKVVTK